jgi:hypothetical protein
MLHEGRVLSRKLVGHRSAERERRYACLAMHRPFPATSRLRLAMHRLFFAIRHPFVVILC